LDDASGLAPKAAADRAIAGAHGPAPTRDACLARIERVDPQAYARSRNHLEGAVTGLSPWISHGVVTLREVAQALARRHRLEVQHKLVFELGWRAYFRHVWEHRGEAILGSIHPGPLPDAAYRKSLPADLRRGACGVPAIDQAIRTLYRTGLLHNHARMWLASHVVHMRRVHWRAGADWMIGHLLDGDLASNHLSWQWVAGTASRKPYLFNADNVARYAPRDWWSPGSVIDRSYAELAEVAHGALPAAMPPEASGGVDEPACAYPPFIAGLQTPTLGAEASASAASPCSFTARLAGLRNCAIWLLHPWGLRLPPAHAQGKPWHVLGCLPSEAMQQHAWSSRRIRWVIEAMQMHTRDVGQASLQDLAGLIDPSCTLGTWADGHINPFLPARIARHAEVPLFPPVPRRCDSFSRWWAVVTRGVNSLEELLDLNNA